MVTKLEVLALYNAERGTNYTLQTLAAELLKNVLNDQWQSEKIKVLSVDVLT